MGKVGVVSVAVFAVLFISGCSSNQALAKREWPAVSANGAVLSASDLSGDVTAVIKDVSCSDKNASAYSVEVDWLTSVTKADRGIIEYHISKSSTDESSVNLNKTATTFDLDEVEGAETFEIAGNEIEDAGNTIIVSMTIQKKDGTVIKSIPDKYPVTELCYKED
jgi:hypothetical protein